MPKFNVDALLDSVNRAKVLMNKTNFKNNCLSTVFSDKHEVAKALLLCYKVLVESRNCVFLSSDELDAIFLKVAGWMSNPESKPWLMIYGPVGNGKTTLLKAIIMLINSQQLRYGNNIASMKLFNSIRITELAKENPDYFGKVKDAIALGIDDIGIEPLEVNGYGTKTGPMVDLFLQRYATLDMTIFTSNLDREAMKNRYKDRVADRLKEVCDLLYIGFDSYRH